MTKTNPHAVHDGMRVVVCAPGETWGGVEQFVVTLIAGLRRRHVEVCAALFHDGRLAKVLRETGIEVELISERSHDPEQGRHLRRLQHRFRADVVHTHGYRATIVAAAARIAGANAPIVKTEHGRLEWPSQLRHVPGFVKLLANSLVDRVATRGWIDQVVYVSADTRTALGRWMGRGPVIYNGIDPEAVQRQVDTVRRVEGRFVVGIVGRLVPVKGHTDFLRALALLPRSVVGRILGAGPEEEALRRLTHALGVADRVEFRGFVDPVYPEMAALDVLVMPSLHEGLPYALLEAMSLGVAVLATSVGGLPELVQHDDNGTMVAARDPSALAEAIRRLQQDPARRQALARRAMDSVASTFHVDTMVEAYLEVFARAISSRSTTSPEWPNSDPIGTNRPGLDRRSTNDVDSKGRA